jgi:hypothetical protein
MEKRIRDRYRIIDLDVSLADLAKRLRTKIGLGEGFINLEYHKPHYIIVQYNDKGLKTYPFGSAKRQKKEMYQAIEMAIYTIDMYKNLPQ